jgi:gliding motility-associated-like protein
MVTIDSLIFVLPDPDAAFSVEKHVLPNYQQEVIFTNSSTGAENYFWDFGDETTSNEINPVHIFAKYGYQTIVLKAINRYSCSDTATYKILAKFDKIYPPNAFSPNARDAVDRVFTIGSGGVDPQGYHLVILSRWNDIVFEANNEIRGWDGRMQNGNYAPAGNYVWKLDYFDFLGKSHRQTGTVTLIY